MATGEKKSLPSELGVVKIADEVVSVVAGLAAVEVDGVASMSGGISGGLADVLGRRNLAKGVKVEVGAEEAKIDIFIVVKQGVRIPDVAWDIQENVKKSVENTTGLNVSNVNVHVQGIHFPQKEKADDALEGSVDEKAKK